MLLGLKNQLSQKKYLMVNSDDFPLTTDEWEKTKKLIDPRYNNYERKTTGHKGDTHNTDVLRILLAGTKEPLIEGVLPIIFSQKVKKFLEAITGIKNAEVARCQSHILYEGCFIGKHWDNFEIKEYLSSVIFILSDDKDYDGGEFVVCYDEGELFLKPSRNSVFIMDCNMPHRVEAIRSGARMSLVYFLKEGPITC